MIKQGIHEGAIAWDELYRSLEKAGAELYSFGYSLMAGDHSEVEALVLDALFLALEQNCFQRDEKNLFSYEDSREELFSIFWQLAQKQLVLLAPKGEAKFYLLPLASRAALFLRMRGKFSEASIARILGESNAEVQKSLSVARSALLGRNLPPVVWDEEFS